VACSRTHAVVLGAGSLGELWCDVVSMWFVLAEWWKSRDRYDVTWKGNMIGIPLIPGQYPSLRSA
jgi:hypothetical protein